MWDVGLEILLDTSESKSVYDGLFGLLVEEPLIDNAAWEREVKDRGGVMTVPELQTEYAAFLAEKIALLQEEITNLIAYIRENDLESLPGVQQLLHDLSHDEIYKEVNGKLILVDEGGLYERLARGRWVLEHYDFHEKKLRYLVPDDRNIEWIERVEKMSPDQVLSDAYHPVSQRVAIKLPDLNPTRRAVS